MGKRFLVLMYCLLGVSISCSKSAGPSPSQPKAQASPAAAAAPASLGPSTGSEVTTADIQMWSAGEKWLRTTPSGKKDDITFSTNANTVQGGTGERPELTVNCEKSKLTVILKTGPITSSQVQVRMDDQPKSIHDWYDLGGNALAPRNQNDFLRKLLKSKTLEVLYDEVGGSRLATFKVSNLPDILSKGSSCKL